MIVASHQIDLLPFPGFFNRMIVANIFDLGGHYDWWRKGAGIYQHRVKIGFDNQPTWLTLPVDAKAGMTQDEVKLKTELVPALFDKIYGVYRPCENFHKYADMLEDKFKHPPEYLWQFNLDLLLWLRDMLGIFTPISISKSTKNDMNFPATWKVSNQLSTYSTSDSKVTYYCGSGGKDYLDIDYMSKIGIQVVFQDYGKVDVPDGFRTVSILSMLMCMEPGQIRRRLDDLCI